MALLRGLADLLFPPACQVCRRPGEFPLCRTCTARFPLIHPPVCQKCGNPLRGPPDLVFTCIPCRHRRLHYRLARSVGIYDGSLREAVHALKFGGCQAIARPLGTIMAEAAAREPAFRSSELIVPVPLHPSRQRERRFNQTELLAAEIAQELGIELNAKLLRRTRPTISQVGLPLDQRRANVREAFVAEPHAKARRIMLVDDVMSSGATVVACARALRCAGAREIVVLTLAKAILR